MGTSAPYLFFGFFSHQPIFTCTERVPKLVLFLILPFLPTILDVLSSHAGWTSYWIFSMNYNAERSYFEPWIGAIVQHGLMSSFCNRVTYVL